MSGAYTFYKGIPSAWVPYVEIDTRPAGTILYSPDNPSFKWTQVITTRRGKCWAKIALRNVPKKYRMMLLLLT